MFSNLLDRSRKRVLKWKHCIYKNLFKIYRKSGIKQRKVCYIENASPKSPQLSKNMTPIVSNEITLNENTQERTIEGFKIYLDKEDVNYFDENEWRINKKGSQIYTLTNKNTKKQLHRIIMKVEDNKNITVKFKNPCSGDFRKQNLVSEENSIVLQERKNEREKKQHFVFVDTETTGLIPEVRNKYGQVCGYVNPRNKVVYENARLISISYMITDGMNNTIMEPKHLYVKPYDFEIPSNSTKLNGITKEYAFEHGSHLKTVMTEFENDIKNHNVTYFVAHNVLFDAYIVMNTALRRGWTSDPLLLHLEHRMNYYCTCKRKDPITKKLIFPKLKASVIKFLKEVPVGLHNALNDMIYCKRLFFELRSQNLITEQTFLKTKTFFQSKK